MEIVCGSRRGNNGRNEAEPLSGAGTIAAAQMSLNAGYAVSRLGKRFPGAGGLFVPRVSVEFR